MAKYKLLYILLINTSLIWLEISLIVLETVSLERDIVFNLEAAFGPKIEFTISLAAGKKRVSPMDEAY
jgi:hypothetical protein